MRKLNSFFLSLVLLGFCAPLPAQEDLRDPYLAGVSAYNAGRFEVAEEQLSMAIDQSPRDPRPYYFLGLTKMAQGDRTAGAEDIRQAATLELAANYSYAAIDRALASVQGPPRTTVEQIRREVRLATERTERTEMARQRRIAWEEQEKQVLRTRTELPIEALVNQLTPDQALAAATKSRGMAEEYVDSDAAAGGALANRGTDTPPEQDPFGDEPNPFADDAGQEMAPEAGPAVATADEETPFDVDPFSEPRPVQPRVTIRPDGGAPGGPPGGAPSPEAVAGQLFYGLGRLLSGRIDIPMGPGGFGPGGDAFGAEGEGFDGGEFGDPEAFGPPGEMAPEDAEEFEPPAGGAPSPFDEPPVDDAPGMSPEPGSDPFATPGEVQPQEGNELDVPMTEGTEGDPFNE